jgi:hypothetical protein
MAKLHGKVAVITGGTRCRAIRNFARGWTPELIG